jgi:hypothetical protein
MDYDADRTHSYALNEAKYVVDLIDAGLNGYIVDPECDKKRPNECWSDRSLGELATQFCNMIKLHGRRKDQNFFVGLTSGGTYPDPHNHPDIPWTEFVAHSDALFPQCYWLGDRGSEHGGTPQKAFDECMSSWRRISPKDMTIVPILGQIKRTSAADIANYQKIINEHKLSEVHFYTYEDDITQDRWDAMRSLEDPEHLLSARLDKRGDTGAALTEDLRASIDRDQIPALIKNGGSALTLARAQRAAKRAWPPFPDNGCAANLSALLRESGITVPMTLGAGKLAHILKSRGWNQIDVGQQAPGDVGVAYDEAKIPGVDHIYLVVSTIDKDEMIIADNQDTVPHHRFATGHGKSPTAFFLRAEVA